VTSLIRTRPSAVFANAPRRPREKRPFESWEQIEAVAAKLGPLHGPMIIFGAATGLRPSELFVLEQPDIDRRRGVVSVRRAYANGRLKQTKTWLSNRAVPLQAKALEALDRLAPSENPILFPNSRGGWIDFRIFGRKHSKPAQRAVGIEPLRDLYDLRHIYVTFALRAGVPVFAVSRFIGSSIAMIDQYYGRLAHDSREHAVSLLDALAFERAVDAAWTSPTPRLMPVRKPVSVARRRRSRRPVDARWTPRLVSVATSENENS
jgi:integrase